MILRNVRLWKSEYDSYEQIESIDKKYREYDSIIINAKPFNIVDE